ncbi:hypothetical protein [Mycolicibacterium aurum]|nr:hypothetical protein [Mycolicibacterium aurum]
MNAPYSTSWFLERGLPSVIGRRARWSRVISRSAPVLAGWATLMCASLFVMVASGDRDIDVDGDPAPLQWLALIVLFAIAPAVLMITWAVSRIHSVAARRTVAWVSIIAGIASDLYEDELLDAVDNIAVDVATVLAILVCTGLGLGSIGGWALRTTWVHFRSAARLMFRALPVVLLTILVFFNAPVWTISSNLDGMRTWLLVAFLGAVATSYLVAGLIDSVGPIMRGWQGASEAPGTGDDRQPLTGAERANVLLVAATSQVIQALAIAVVVGSLYFVLGMIVLNPANVAHLTGGGPLQSQWLGVTVPAAPAHLRVTAFLMILTYMYICARAVGDGEYRSSFLDPLLRDLHTTLDARDRLLSGRAADDGAGAPLSTGPQATPPKPASGA